MANQLKYVIMKTDDGREFPLIFGSVLSHKGVADHAENIYYREADKRGEIVGDVEPVAAGFFQLHDGGFTCYGESETLKMKSRGTVDDEVIKQWG